MAYLQCRANKRKTVNALKFEIDFENKLRELLDKLEARTYVPGQAICFVVTVPKPREIFAADFRDRIIHHLLVHEIEDFFEKRFVFDSYACRRGKGTHRAVSRLIYFLGKKENKKACYLKMDVKSFFMSIDKRILYQLTWKSLMDRSLEEVFQLDWLIRTVIFHDPAKNYVIKGDKKLFSLIPPHKSLLGKTDNKGLPIGNHSSQFLANVYLNELDQFVKRELKCKYYIRYMDDIVLLCEDKQKLAEWRDMIREFLPEKLNIEINDKKTIIQPVERGINFLGYFLEPDRIHSRREVVGRYKNKLFEIAVGSRKTNLDYLQSMHNSFMGHFEFKGKFPARVRKRSLVFAERAKLPALIFAAPLGQETTS